MPGFFYAFLVAFGYASSNFYMKKGMEKASKESGVYLALLINSLTACVLAIYFLIKNPLVLDGMGFLFIALSGMMGPIFGRLTFYKAINNIGITLSSSIKITAPVFAALIAFFLLGETLSLSAIMGMLVVLFGLYKLSNKKDQKNSEKSGQLLSFKEGITFALLSAVCFAAGNVFRKIGLQYIDFAILGLLISTSCSLLVYTIYFLAKGKLKNVISIDRQSRNSFIIGGLYTSLATFCYFLSLKTIPVAVAVTIANTEPIFVILLGKYFFKTDEKLSLNMILNIAIIFTGVVIISIF